MAKGLVRLAVQLYTLRERLQQDFQGTLRDVADIGFEGVEFAGYGGLLPEAVRDCVKELGLVPVASHVPLHRLQDELDAVIREAQIIGIGTVVCPFIPEPLRGSENQYRELAQFFNRVGQACRRAGLTFAYHNHAFEFQLWRGRTALDLLYECTHPDLVEFELDVYWVEFARKHAARYIAQYASRCRLLHVKDMTGDEERFFEVVGRGVLPWPLILGEAERAGVEWYIVEQDVCRRDPLESVRLSYEYLTSLTGAARSGG